MNKPRIAIFCASNLPTVAENKIINNLSMYSCTILNAETFNDSHNINVDAVIGAVPAKYKHLPEPKVVIDKYLAYLGGLGDNVGGKAETKPKDKGKVVESTKQPVGQDTAPIPPTGS